MRKLRQFTVAVAIALTPAILDAQSGTGMFQNWKDATKPRAPKNACTHLRSLTNYDFSIDNATLVPRQADVPEFCLVQGQIAPEVRFEIGLPKDWNGRLYMFGNGGFAGEPLAAQGRVATRNRAIARGFATAQTNTGHEASREPLATFAANPQKLIDYAYRAVHVTAVTAKTLARAYYDAPASKSYFVGCSTGGRQGLISAQRFPDDFDGIVVGAPVLDFTGTMIHFAAIHRALGATPISAERVKVIAEKVYAKCDAADGLTDGLIDDPRRCQFDPAKDVPQCASSTDSGACLTAEQAKAVQVVYGDVMSKGARVFPGLPVGAEAFVPSPTGPRSGWTRWILSDGQPTIAQQFAESFFKEMVTPGTPIDWRQFDPERDMDRMTTIKTLLNATDPDLTRFRTQGGKILMYFGWADPALNPLMGINYYEQMRQTMGAGTGEFFRLFMMPGVLHCGGGVGPSLIDPITPLVEWVERGVAPDRLVASQQEGGKTIRTRPLCVYPMVAKYNGSGSKDDAASFTCAPQAAAGSSP
jgi:hypothetical protein